MHRKELSSLINKVSKSKPLLPFLVGGGLVRYQSLVPLKFGEYPKVDLDDDIANHAFNQEKWNKENPGREIYLEEETPQSKEENFVSETGPIDSASLNQKYRPNIEKNPDAEQPLIPEGNPDAEQTLTREKNPFARRSSTEQENNLDAQTPPTEQESNLDVETPPAEQESNLDAETPPAEEEYIEVNTHTLEGGIIFEGDLVEGKMHGEGRLIYPDGGGVFEGTFVDGLLQGEGMAEFKNGNMYHGNFVDQKKCGEGKLYYKTGEMYDGEFDNNAPNGVGT